MIYVSIDIETSGLDPEKNKIFSLSAIIEDTNRKLSFDEIPKFNSIIIQREIIGSPRALHMNKYLIECIGHYIETDITLRQEIEKVTGYSFYEEQDVVPNFYEFLKQNGIKDSGENKPITLNVAGKNFGTFDKLFLERLPNWKRLIRTRQRVIDPGILFCKWDTDESLPSLSECKERAQIDGVVTHESLKDAWDVIELLRKFY